MRDILPEEGRRWRHAQNLLLDVLARHPLYEPVRTCGGEGGSDTGGDCGGEECAPCPGGGVCVRAAALSTLMSASLQ